ncbi:hypothetical protein KR009_003748 [Drosophila setifemur]|nr:hypothetical protein KR009_003748 [Drosophila setifemur]
MHIEIQVALNFVISYLYNKLPRRRVNIFGEELEKALRDKFQGHWYPDKPFKGSAYRCLKTGDPIDSVLERAARESGVPISDVLENLPNELSVWVDPGEVSFRIGEKGAVKILYTENNENHEDSHSADREVTKTFNPEAQCFRPIDAVNTTMNNLSLSPKALPLSLPQMGCSPHSVHSCSPTYKGSPNPTAAGSCCSGSGSGPSLGSGSGPVAGNGVSANSAAAAFMQRVAQAPLTFTTATFAQTKFGSTKLKTSSKRTNSSAYRMSPTEFSNYIKQRAIQQQMHHGHGVGVPSTGSVSAFAGLDTVSPARSLSPNPLALGGGSCSQSTGGAIGGSAGAADPFYYSNMAIGLYPQFGGQHSLFDSHFNADAVGLGLFGTSSGGASAAASKYNAYLEPCYFSNGMTPHQQQSVAMDHTNSSTESCFGLDVDCGAGGVGVGGLEDAGAAAAAVAISGESSSPDNSPIGTPTVGVVPTLTAAAAAAATAAASAGQQQSQESSSSAAPNSKLIDGISSFYGTGSSYQQLLVAN